MVRKSLKPKIDILPLIKAKDEAETEEEKALIWNLQCAIVEGRSWPRTFMVSGEARKKLSCKSVDALGRVLDDAAAYDKERKQKWYTIVDDDDTDEEVQENYVKRPIKGKGDTEANFSRTPIVLKGKVVGKTKIDLTESGYVAKYKLYLEVGNEEGGFKQFDVYEECDSGLSSGLDVTWSPCTSEEWDPNKQCFVLMEKEPKKMSDKVSDIPPC